MSKSETSDPKPGHYFDLLDRTHIASAYLQMALGEHPVLARHPELMALYENVLDRLETLYQAVGQLDETWQGDRPKGLMG